MGNKTKIQHHNCNWYKSTGNIQKIKDYGVGISTKMALSGSITDPGQVSNVTGKRSNAPSRVVGDTSVGFLRICQQKGRDNCS